MVLFSVMWLVFGMVLTFTAMLTSVISSAVAKKGTTGQALPPFFSMVSAHKLKGHIHRGNQQHMAKYYPTFHIKPICTKVDYIFAGLSLIPFCELGPLPGKSQIHSGVNFTLDFNLCFLIFTVDLPV